MVCQWNYMGSSHLHVFSGNGQCCFFKINMFPPYVSDLTRSESGMHEELDSQANYLFASELLQIYQKLTNRIFRKSFPVLDLIPLENLCPSKTGNRVVCHQLIDNSPSKEGSKFHK